MVNCINTSIMSETSSEDTDYDHSSDDEYASWGYELSSKHLRDIASALKTELKETWSGPPVDSYFAEGTIQPEDVSLEVDGFGKISFPVTFECATQLMNMASLAAFGQGKQTKYDQNVRDTYTIPGDKLNVSINNIADILSNVRQGLALNENCVLQAHIYNLLIYKEGQFFDYHRDTEKMDNMVATLVISLPCLHIGGNLIIKHFEKSHVFCTETIRPNIIKYIGFYSDCYHKVERVRQGYRIVLILNVALKESRLLPTVECSENLLNTIKQYFEHDHNEHNKKMKYSKRITKLVLFFDHHYSIKDFRFGNLKGSDTRMASLIVHAAKKLHLICYLALATVFEQWTDDHITLLEASCNLHSWRDEDDQTVPFDKHKCYIEETCWLKHNRRMKPHRTHHTGYTGNAGYTHEREYHRGAIVLWPQAFNSKMLFELNPKEEMNKLKTLIRVPCNEEVVQNILNTDGAKLLESYTDDCKTLLVELAIYIKNPDRALEICKSYFMYIVSCENSNSLLCTLRDTYGSTWISKLFCEGTYPTYQFSKKLLNLIPHLKQFGQESCIDAILESQLNTLTNFTRFQNDIVNNYGSFIQTAYEHGRLDFLDKILECIISQSKIPVDPYDTFYLEEPRTWLSEELGELYLQYCKDLPQNITVGLKEATINSLQTDIVKYRALVEKLSNPTSWSVVQLKPAVCLCEVCRNMIDFLRSNSKSLSFRLNKHCRKHVYRIYKNSPLYNMKIDRSVRPFTLFVEKTDEVKIFPIRKLSKLEEQLETISPHLDLCQRDNQAPTSSSCLNVINTSAQFDETNASLEVPQSDVSIGSEGSSDSDDL